MKNALLVFFGGGMGAMARYASTHAINRWMGSGTFPWHTLGVNLLGAFLIGFLMELLAVRFALAEPMRLLLITGFLGGYTTFSAFALEGALMIQRGNTLMLCLYVAASIIGCIGAVFIGSGIVKAIT